VLTLDTGNQLPLASVQYFNYLNRDVWVARKAATVPAGSKVLDAGAGTCPYKHLFAHCEYVSQDFMKYQGYIGSYGDIDIISSIDNIPVKDQSFDVVLCTEVLEHVTDPIAAVKELSRVLKPGGRILITAPLGSGLHQRPYHYYGGYTPEWYDYFFAKFKLELVEIIANGGFFKHLAQECARVAWTFEQHRHLHGERAGEIFQLFNETLPRYLYNLDEQCYMPEFSVGFHVEGRKKSR
jgi:SAM-dependent methyltransferase